jgi:hypothetical protein
VQGERPETEDPVDTPADGDVRPTALERTIAPSPATTGWWLRLEVAPRDVHVHLVKGLGSGSDTQC